METVEKKSTTETIKFQKSKIMSTYLVAVVVGEFDYLEDKTIDGTVVRVYTPKNKQEQGRFALEVATKVLPYYNKYFGISYPLPKMDLIAIADFSAGAMENWGKNNKYNYITYIQLNMSNTCNIFFLFFIRRLGYIQRDLSSC